MMKMTLSDQERDQREEAFQPTRDRRLRARCQAILMAARGRRHRHIAEDVGLSGRTIQRWLKADQQRGLTGLKSRWAPGRVARIPEALAPTIRTWITQGPAGCGLDRATWTSAALATSLSQTNGITVSDSTMRRFCQRRGVRPYRPTYRDLNADPGQQETARQDLDALKKQPRPGNSAC